MSTVALTPLAMIVPMTAPALVFTAMLPTAVRLTWPDVVVAAPVLTLTTTPVAIAPVAAVRLMSPLVSPLPVVNTSSSMLLAVAVIVPLVPLALPVVIVPLASRSPPLMLMLMSPLSPAPLSPVVTNSCVTGSVNTLMPTSPSSLVIDRLSSSVPNRLPCSSRLSVPNAFSSIVSATPTLVCRSPTRIVVPGIAANRSA